MKDESMCPVHSRKDHDKKSDSPKGLFEAVGGAVDKLFGMGGGQQQQAQSGGAVGGGGGPGGQLAGIKKRSRKIELESVAKLDAERRKNSPTGFLDAGISIGEGEFSGSAQKERGPIGPNKRLKVAESLGLGELKGKRKGIQLTKGQRKK